MHLSRAYTNKSEKNLFCGVYSYSKGVLQLNRVSGFSRVSHARYSQLVRNSLKWISNYSTDPGPARCSAHLYECYKDGVRCTRRVAIRTRYRTRTTTGTIPRRRAQPRRGRERRARSRRASWRSAQDARERVEFVDGLAVRHYRSIPHVFFALRYGSSPCLNRARIRRVLDVILS